MFQIITKEIIYSLTLHNKEVSEYYNKLYTLLKPFGLKKDHTRIYIYLLGEGEVSVLSISRKLGISRSRVYLLLEKLSQLGLVSEVGRKTKRRFVANSYKQFEILTAQKKREVEMLEGSIPPLFQQLGSLEIGKHKKSKIMHYKGIEGLKTVTWNSTEAVGTLRVFELASDMSAFLDFDFSERVRIEYVQKGVLKSSKQLTNFRQIRPWTNISGLIDLWDCRYVDPKDLDMSMEIVVYNETVTMYQFQRKEIFCIEIFNADHAEMIKNLFDYVWSRSAKMKKLGQRGEAVIV
jgi:predicted transcriptional regulator